MHCVPAHPRPCLKRGGRVSRVFSLVVGCSRMAFSLFEEVRINPLPTKFTPKSHIGANYFVARRKCMPCAGCVIVFFISCYGRKGLGIPSPPSPPSPSSPARRRRLPVLAAVRQWVIATAATITASPAICQTPPPPPSSRDGFRCAGGVPSTVRPLKTCDIRRLHKKLPLAQLGKLL